MKRFLVAALLLSLTGCTSILSPHSLRHGATGTPLEGDGDGGGGGSPPAATFNLPTSGTVSATGTLVVPISLADYDDSGGGSKGVLVTILLSAGLQLAPNLSGVQPGSYLTGSGCGNDPSPIFSATYNADGTVTIVAALNPGKQSHCSGGTVFNVAVTPRAEHSGAQYVGLTSSPAGAVTPSPTLKNACCNANIPVSYGNATDTITIQ